MILRKVLSVLFMVSLVFAVPSFAFANHGGDLDCDDFASQEEAQKHWDEHGYSADNDPERLDRDNDGVPCEEGGSGSGGGSDDGSGSDNSGSSNQGGQLPKTATSHPTMVLIGSGILAAGAGLLLYRRRQSA